MDKNKKDEIAIYMILIDKLGVLPNQQVIKSENLSNPLNCSNISKSSGGNTSRQYTISVTNTITAQGMVSGGGTYSEGFRVNVTATPKIGYQFEKWSDGETSSLTILVTKNLSLTASFKASVGLETGSDQTGGYNENPVGEDEDRPDYI